jgi:short-subunit dehydrogenase
MTSTTINREKVLITGGASGIGFHLAKTFLSNGFFVFITDINKPALDEAVRQLNAYGNPNENGQNIRGIKCDVTSYLDVINLRTMIGNIDVLINNAGIGHTGEMANMNVHAWRNLIEINLMGPIHHLCAFLPGMIKRGSGHIMNISSGQTFFRMPTWGAYAATKAALAVISDVLSYELIKHNIHVTTVFPFLVNTPFYVKGGGETFVGRISMKWLPYYADKPEDVANRIYEAFTKKKRTEMVNPLNILGVVLRTLPSISSLSSHVMTKLFIDGGKK